MDARDTRYRRLDEMDAVVSMNAFDKTEGYKEQDVWNGLQKDRFDEMALIKCITMDRIQLIH